MTHRFTFEGQIIDPASVSERARKLMEAISETEAQIRQLENEWAIADTARLAYLGALNRERKTGTDGGSHG